MYLMLERPLIVLDEDGSESLSTATPHESTEMDDIDQEKHLLSATLADGGLTFVKEPQS